MLLSYIVSDFEKINFKGITKFCKRLNYNVKATVKMDSNGVHITILDEDKNVGINIVGVHDISEELHAAYKNSNNFLEELTKISDRYYDEIKQTGMIAYE